MVYYCCNREFCWEDKRIEVFARQFCILAELEDRVDELIGILKGYAPDVIDTFVFHGYEIDILPF